MSVPRVLVHIGNGVLNQVEADGPVEVVVLDEDTEGGAEQRVTRSDDDFTTALAVSREKLDGEITAIEEGD